MPQPEAPRALDPKDIVRRGYDLVSRAYRDDVGDLEESGYRHWLSRVTPNLAPGARVLDLGCGCGVPVARELAKRFAVTGVDLSPVQIERARTLVPDARFVCDDMTTVAFDDGSFEAVVAFFSIINVPLAEQPELFRRIARWLVPGGRMLAMVGKQAWTGTEANWRGVPGATMYWSHANVWDYRKWLEQAGLAIVEEGTQPEQGNPGFAVLIARRPD